MFPSVVWPTWNELFHGEVTFAEMGDMLSGIFTDLVGHEQFLNILNYLKAQIVSFIIPALLVGMLGAFILAFFGRKLLPVVKPLFFLLLGFTVGVSVVSPLLTSIGFEIYPWIIGLIIGVILMIFSKYLYIALYVVAFAYSAYMIFMGGQLLPETVVSFTKDNMIFSLCAVCITIVLVFLLRKLIETIGTAALGGYLVALSLEGVLFELFGIGKITAVTVIITVLVGLIGAVRQLRGKRSKKAKGEKKVKASKKK